MKPVPVVQDILNGVDPTTRLPYGVSRFYADLALNNDPDHDPIAAQFVPRRQERDVLGYEDGDPIGDVRYMVAPRLVHHYADRALLLVNDRCAVYCRHCFRRHFTGHGSGRVTTKELEAVCDYLSRTPGVREVLLSGGDPLMLADTEFFSIIDRLRAVNNGYLIRVCTRLPVVLPSRITGAFADQLGRRAPAWVVVHCNHPRELTAEFADGVRRLLGAGVPVANQTVLLRGVNDSADILEPLLAGLVRMGVKPYYLFQGDLAAGTAHFRTSIERGIEIMRTLRSRLSGLAIPTYAVDLPGGGGKVPVESALLRTEADSYVFRGPDGAEYRYPREHPTDGHVLTDRSLPAASVPAQHPVD